MYDGKILTQMPRSGFGEMHMARYPIEAVFWLQ